MYFLIIWWKKQYIVVAFCCHELPSHLQLIKILLFYSDDEGTLKFDLLVWVEVYEMLPSGE